MSEEKTEVVICPKCKANLENEINKMRQSWIDYGITKGFVDGQKEGEKEGFNKGFDIGRYGK